MVHLFLGKLEPYNRFVKLKDKKDRRVLTQKKAQKDFAKTMPNIIVGSGFNDASLGLAYFNLNSKLKHANPALEKMFGYTTEQMSKMTFSEVTHPDDLHKFTQLESDFKEGRSKSKNIDVRCFRADGKTLYLRILFSIMRSDIQQKDADYYMAVVEDLTDQYSTEKEKILNRRVFEIIAEYSPTTVWLATSNFEEILFINDSFCNIWGITRENITSNGREHMLKRVHPDDRADALRVFESIANGPKEDHWSHEFRIVRDNGSIVYIEDRGRVVRDENGVATYLVGTHHDITSKMVYTEKLELLNSELQKAYDKVKRLSEYDSLTNCLNRAAMTSRLSDTLYQYNRYEIPATIIYLDLNGFKQINDKYGHYVGDQVLIQFVEKMQGLIRQSDILGRMGGDEFLLLFSGANQLSAEHFLAKNQKQFQTIVEIPNKKPISVNLSFSAGIAEIDFSVNNIDEWIDIADRAMYVDKISSQ